MEGITSTTRPIKVSLGGELRRINVVIESSFAQVLQQIRDLYQLPPTSSVSLRYQDEEGDWITISSDGELKLAFEISVGKILRLEAMLKPEQSQPSLPSTPVMQHQPMLVLPNPVPQQNAPVAVGPFSRGTDEPARGLMHKRMQIKEAKAQFKEAKKFEKENHKALQGKGKMLARFVKHVTFEDDTVLAPGTPFIKTWRFRNETSYPWPAKSFVLCVGKQADQMGPERVEVPKGAAPGEEADVSVPLVAPRQPGRYVGFYRLAGGEQEKKFGQRVRVQILVVDPNSPVQGAAKLNLLSSSSSSDSESDEERKERKLNKMFLKNEALRPLVQQLEHMGFSDRLKNAKVLKKCSGDIDQAVVLLLKWNQKKFNKKVKKDESKNKFF